MEREQMFTHTYKTQEREVEAKARANSKMLLEIERMRKMKRRSSRSFSVCLRRTALSTRHDRIPLTRGIVQGCWAERSRGESEDKCDSDSEGVNNPADARRRRDRHENSWRSFTSTLGVSTDRDLQTYSSNSESDTSQDTDTERLDIATFGACTGVTEAPNLDARVNDDDDREHFSASPTLTRVCGISELSIGKDMPERSRSDAGHHSSNFVKHTVYSCSIQTVNGAEW